MYFQIALMVIMFLATALLAPVPKVENARPSGLNDFRVPRADEGDPTPIVIGTARLRSPNTIWYGALRSEPMVKKIKYNIFGATKKQVTGYKYYLGLDLALCLGPGVKLLRIWAGKDVAWQGDLSTESTFNISKYDLFGGDSQRGGIAGDVTFYPGSFSQSQDSYLVSQLGSEVPRYGGIAHLVFRDFYVGLSPSLEPFNFELQRLPNALDLPAGKHVVNGLDSNPMEALFDIITNRWGRLGVSTDLLDLASWREAALRLHDEGNGISLIIAKANTGKDVLEEVLRQIDGVMYQDPVTAKIKVKLIRQDYDRNTLPVFDASNVIAVSDFTAKLWKDTYNQTRVKFTNRAKDYADGVADAQDFANIGMQRRARSSTLNFPGCNTPELAARLAARGLSMVSVPLVKCRLTCTRAAQALRPGDVFRLAWPEYGIADMVFRVQRFDLGELANGRVVVEVLQDRFAADTVVLAPPQPSQWQSVSRRPAAVTTRRILEAPYALRHMWKSFDPENDGSLSDPAPTRAATTFVLARTPTSFSTTVSAYQSLSSSFSEPLDIAFEDLRYGGSASVKIGFGKREGDKSDGSDGEVRIVGLDKGVLLRTASAGTVDGSGDNLILIDDEILAFKNYTQDPDGTVRLTGLWRGLCDTVPADHNQGADVYFLVPEQLSELYYKGTDTVYTRICDQTDAGIYAWQNAVSIATPMADRASRPACPTNIRVNGSRAPVVVSPSFRVTWTERGPLTIGAGPSVSLPPTGTTYTMRVYLDNRLVYTASGVKTVADSPPVGAAPDGYDVTLPAAEYGAKIRVEISALLAGRSSLYTAWLDGDSTYQPTLAPVYLDQEVQTATLTGAWGLRKMVSTYSGPLARIRDTVNNVEQDLFASTDPAKYGVLNTGFTVGGNAAVVKLYDQSGNGRHLEQATAARQPVLNKTGTPGGKPYIKFDGSDDFLADPVNSTSHPYMTAAPDILLAHGPRNSAATSWGAYVNIPHSGTSNASPYSRIGLYAQNNTVGWSTYFNGNRTDFTPPSQLAPNAQTNWSVWALCGGEMSAWNSGSTSVLSDRSGTATITYPNASHLRVGANASGLEATSMAFMEVATFATPIDSLERQTVLNKVATFWNVAA